MNTTAFTIRIFKAIQEAKSVDDIRKITTDFKELAKNVMDEKKYPKIDFTITPSDIKALIENKIIDENGDFAEEVSSKITDPLTKLLYAMAWKNGDLNKLKDIIKGVLDTKEEDDQSQETALVFQQFGRYLSKKTGEPIIDQHVIRAFGVYYYSVIFENEEEANRYFNLKSLSKKNTFLIGEYKKWLSQDLNEALRNEEDYAYEIDKLLFAVGKTIKR